jgi:hypothetical protein
VSGTDSFTAFAEDYADFATRARDFEEVRHDIGSHQVQAISDYQRETGAAHSLAERAVFLMADHIVQLATERFFSQPGARELVIRECVLWLRGSTDLASAAAHRYWERWWTLKRAGLPDWVTDVTSTSEGERAMGFEFWRIEASDAEDKWRAAWENFLTAEGIASI